MPTPDNTVTLLINGKTHGQWTDYDIVSDLLTPADDFSVTLGRPVDAKPDAVQPGDKVEVRVGNDTVLSGRIDRVQTITEKGHKTLMIQGRDDAGVLLDCSAPLFNAQDMDLHQIIEKIVKPLGLVKICIDAAKTDKAHKVQIEPSCRAWDALLEYADANGLWPWLEPDGTLVVGGPDYTAEPVAELVLRSNGQNNNIKRLEVSRDMAARYSEVTVLAQSHSGKNNIKATAKDDSLKLHRPLIVTEPDIDSQAEAQRKAKKRLADSRLAGLTITATVQGHRTDNGTLWQPGQRINVLSEPDGIDAVYFLMARTFTGGRGQPTETVLTLKEDGAWVLDADPPKKSGKAKRPSENRKANGQATAKPKKRRQAKKPKQELQVI
ncbi:phage baseplate assembly protein [Neisseria dentiae]|uniref:phage baseplate assembly protein n=1 Tax=Neisseria dentiae TaxID=194197 RepID=UPI00211BEE1D|nr:phage tail protein [Neisseria dentiae]MCQ9325768.1 phage tail protein [Neisseria dentiae]